MGRDVGKVGESVFESLCHNAQITPNQVQIDNTGWDFLLEFPFPYKNKKPLDLEPPTLRCYVQVKSTEIREKGSQIKMTNIKRFIDSADPTFFLFMRFEHQEEVQSIYLVHFDQTLIEKSLKKLRKLSKENVKNIHEKTLLVNYSESNNIGGTSSKNLLKAINSHVPDGMGIYRQWKSNFVKSVGYENYGKRIDVTFQKSDLSHIIDSTLLKESKIPFENIKVYDERFGIPMELENLSSNKGSLILKQIEETFHRSSFSFENKKIWFNVSIFISPFERKGSLTKIRIHGILFDLLMSVKTNKSDLIPLLNSTVPVDIQILSDFSRLLNIIRKNTEGEFMIHNNSQFKIRISFPGIEMKEDLRQFIDASLALPELYAKLELPKDQKFSARDIYEARNRIKIAHETIIVKQRMMMTEFTCDRVIDEGSEMTTVIFLLMPIGILQIGILCSVTGKTSLVQGMVHRLTPASFTIHQANFYENTLHLSKQIVKLIGNLESKISQSEKNLIYMDKKPIVLN